MATAPNHMTLLERFQLTRERTEALVANVHPEAAAIQPALFASPTKWHLAHTTWFFERFILQELVENYDPYSEQFYFLFNSYYDSIGTRQPRHQRGLLSSPTLDDALAYRRAITNMVMDLLAKQPESQQLESLVTIGINHEEQHQELLITDLKYTLGTQPLAPACPVPITEEWTEPPSSEWVDVPEGVVQIGAADTGFRFDNELPRHPEYVHQTRIRRSLVTNKEYLAFMQDGGYTDHRHWHMDGWAWVNEHHIHAPLYWQQIDGGWHTYTLHGLKPIDPTDAVCHVSYYEASAFAHWAGKTLPTEAQWEAASERLRWGGRWEWTNSAYLPYPGYRQPDGAIGEYNGKFMVNQMVLKGASVATTPGHSRPSYRNFFYPDQRWQYTGIRLCT